MAMTTATRDVVDEETPLLSQEQQKKTISPIPWSQISLLLVLQLAEPLTSQVIYPFAPEFVRHSGITHGDETKVGHYVGLMQSIFFAAQAMTVLHWSRISDIVGRKPVILTGLCGLSLSMYCFGLSKTYWSAVISRSLNGILNEFRDFHVGNIGVLKSMIAEITDPSNLAQVYAYMPIAWSTGGTLGPMIGGSLSRPAERFPNVFGDSELMKEYPYFLACAVPATFSALAWFITFFLLKETVRSPVSFRRMLGFRKTKEDLASENNALLQDGPVDESEQPLPVHALLIPRVLIAAVNYASLSLVDIAYRAVQPLFYSTPIELGGLGLSPPTIGLILSIFGILNGVFQVFFFARIHDRWGTKNVFVAGLLSVIPCFALFPVMNVMARTEGMSVAVWCAVALQTVISVAISLSYGCVFIYIAASAPNRASLGATNGLAQMMVSVMRTFGPAATNSLFSLSMRHNYLNGWLVYWVLIVIAFGSFFAALMALSQSQTRESERAVQSVLEERRRKEQVRRKQQEEREAKERELQAKIRMQRLEEERKDRERQEKREQERLAKQREKERREEEQRQVLLHGPKKAKDGGPRWPSSSSGVRDDVRRRRMPSDDDESGGTALTREEKRKRRLEAELSRDYHQIKRSSFISSYSKVGKRLPGGAVDITTTSQPPPPASGDGSMSVRARLAAMPNTLMKLNVVKRDTRTIDEILRDRQKARESKLLEGEDAREFHDWFGTKSKTSEKSTPSPAPTPSASAASNKPSTTSSSYAAVAAPKKGASAPTKSVPSSSSKPTPSSASKLASMPRIPKTSSITKIDTKNPAALSRSTTLSKHPTSSKLASKQSQPAAKKRQRSESLSDSPSPAKRPARQPKNDDISVEIWKLFGKNKGDYMRRDVFSDDEDMEADARDLEMEELRSARLARKEDQLAEEEEKRREDEKRRRKKEKERYA
ncbi:hypothetical protein EW146_g1876 [Bondarzewia mesenterica]|uniref:Major facilitator superfamily (MFS) profile domain-containing protein n=1 Tax=Bondarzewia mesenterica TaxID=1095465 RepID=A0A4S4M2X8_9AGAM|nr:hypothetical protein EW146_g1876 [Bondarzewia mesenterica]